MWTAGFVLLTLIVNAPLLPWVLRITGLSKGVVLGPSPSPASILCSAPWSDTVAVVIDRPGGMGSLLTRMMCLSL